MARRPAGWSWAGASSGPCCGAAGAGRPRGVAGPADRRPVAGATRRRGPRPPSRSSSPTCGARWSRTGPAAAREPCCVTAAPGYCCGRARARSTRTSSSGSPSEGRARARGRRPRAGRRSCCARAAELWRGPALADVPDAPFARAEAARLEELRLGADEDRIDAELALGRHSALVAELERRVQRHPMRERLRAQLMLALYRCGRQADALHSTGRAGRCCATSWGWSRARGCGSWSRRCCARIPTWPGSRRHR